MEQRCELLKKMGTTDIGAIAEESRHHDQKVANHDETLKKNIVNMDNTMTWSPTHNQNKNNIKDEVCNVIITSHTSLSRHNNVVRTIVRRYFVVRTQPLRYYYVIITPLLSYFIRQSIYYYVIYFRTYESR